MVNIPCDKCEINAECIASKKCARLFYPHMFEQVKPITAIKETSSSIRKISNVKNDISGVMVIDMPMQEIRLDEIRMEDLRSYIKIAYDGDQKMQEEFHVLRGTLDEQIAYTYNQSIEDIDDFKHAFFRIVLIENGSRETVIGYTTVVYAEINLLHTFGININFRKDNIKRLWLREIEKLFKYEFYILTLRERNKRAIGFFEKNGFQVEYKVGEPENFYILWPLPL